MNTITKKILIDRIAENTGMKRVAVKQVVQNFLDEVIVELGDGNRLEFRDFGVFEVKQRAPRIAQNPKTLERVPVPAKRTVKFKVGRRMREAMEPVTTHSGASGTETTPGTDSRVTTTASQAESKVRVEMGSGVVGQIRSEAISNREHETANAH
ncbi:MAG: HU family DNA-binding protein [Phycisphaerales bacterium]|nr:HU family DNA-binding protein [Phycisphaerales bacterium]